MNARVLSFVFVAMSAVVVTVTSSAHAENQCAYDEQRSFAFPSATDAASATVQIIGNDCKSATLVISVVDKRGYGIFTHAALFHHLTAVSTDEIGKKDVEYVVARAWALLGPHPLNELPAWVDPEDGFDDEVLPAVDEETYEKARASGDSYLCVTSHYEGGKCYWRDPNGYVRHLKWLSDGY
ncbi:hypothetical protein [Hyphococcus sp.]|uniref:hypothetical protein n=1 Tax=Hyphococcus sp. TaxID=2038636 RepID=UPI0020870325|nr:MAG: hypothetical protein DHS20C04_31190 [Marinicaulis sp.]